MSPSDDASGIGKSNDSEKASGKDAGNDSAKATGAKDAAAESKSAGSQKTAANDKSAEPKSGSATASAKGKSSASGSKSAGGTDTAKTSKDEGSKTAAKTSATKGSSAASSSKDSSKAAEKKADDNNKATAQSTDKTTALAPVPAAQSSSGGAEMPGGVVGLVALLILSGVIGGLIVSLWPRSAPTDAELQAADPVVAARINDVENRLAAVEDSAGAAAQGTADLRDSLGDAGIGDLQSKVDAFSTRIDSLERSFQAQAAAGGDAASAGAAEGLGELRTDIQSLQDIMAQLDAGLTSRIETLEDNAPPADLPTILDGMAGKADIADLASRLDTLEQDRSSSDAKAGALAIALANLARAAENGQPFAGELEAVSILAPDQPNIDVLESYASEGMPRQPELLAGFTQMTRDALNAERSSQEMGFWQRLWANLTGLVTVRRTGELEGNSAEAILARAEMRMREGNWQAAAQELDGLDGPVAEAASSWLQSLKARVQLDALIESLNNSILSGIAGR